MSNSKKSVEKLSIIVSVGILVAAIVFWTIQVRGVMEMLRLAYG